MSYQQAERAYIQGNYTEAASLIDSLTQESPDDPRVRLLRGHIYCYGLQEYATALSDYQAVANLTEDPSFWTMPPRGCPPAGNLVAIQRWRWPPRMPVSPTLAGMTLGPTVSGKARSSGVKAVGPLMSQPYPPKRRFSSLIVTLSTNQALMQG